jgi:hypothetical protein
VLGESARGRPVADEPVAKVLVVDDHRANRLAVEAVLEPLRLEFMMAASGEDALRHLLQEEFALVVLDVHMEGWTGSRPPGSAKGSIRGTCAGGIEHVGEHRHRALRFTFDLERQERMSSRVTQNSLGEIPNQT